MGVERKVVYQAREGYSPCLWHRPGPTFATLSLRRTTLSFLPRLFPAGSPAVVMRLILKPLLPILPSCEARCPCHEAEVRPSQLAFGCPRRSGEGVGALNETT